MLRVPIVTAAMNTLLVVLSYVPLPGSMLCVGVNCKKVLVTVTDTVGSKLVDWIPAEKIVCVYVHVRLICTKVTVSYLTLNLHHYIVHVKCWEPVHINIISREHNRAELSKQIAVEKF